MPHSILIVEDDRATSRLWTKHLEFNGWTVESVPTVEEAEFYLAQQLPNLVILDINLPGALSGWDLLARLRSTQDTNTLPVLVASTLDEPHRAAELGATGFLRKPCSPAVFMDHIQQALECA